MSAQQLAVLEVEGVVHRARRVIRRNVQRLEVVELVFHLGALGDLVARAREQLLDALAHARDRVQRARGLAAPRQRHVDGAADELALDPLALERRAPLLDGFLDSCLGGVDARAGRRALGGLECGQALELLGQQALAPEPVHAQFVERSKAVAGGDPRQRLVGQRAELSHDRIPDRCDRSAGQAASAFLACSAITPKALASWIARSASSLRSISTPAMRRPAISRL